MKILKLKNGKIYKISDVYFAKEVELILNNPEIPENAEIKKGDRIVLKKDVEGLFDYFEEKEKTRQMFWKVRLSYGSEAENVVVSKIHLPVVLWAFAKKSDVVLPSGSFRGKDIISILPDYCLSMGWNRDYEPTSEDWGQIKNDPIVKEMRDFYNEINILCSQVLNEADFKKIVKDKMLLLN